MSHPTKEQVRKWLANEIKQHRPPPDPKQIRRELGWELIEADREQRPCIGDHVMGKGW